LLGQFLDSFEAGLVFLDGLNLEDSVERFPEFGFSHG